MQLSPAVLVALLAAGHLGAGAPGSLSSHLYHDKTTQTVVKPKVVDSNTVDPNTANPKLVYPKDELKLNKSVSMVNNIVKTNATFLEGGNGKQTDVGTDDNNNNNKEALPAVHAAMWECKIKDEFYIYHQGRHGPSKNWFSSGYFNNYFFLPENMQKNHEDKYCDGQQPELFIMADDVSSTWPAARCKGCEDGFDGQDIEEFELHVPAYGHWTYYRDRDHGMYDTENRRMGRCDPTLSRNFYYCGDLWEEFQIGQSMHHCKFEGDLRPC